jgi:methylated-DNA-[protein]-cysteine S-methyltransferase
MRPLKEDVFLLVRKIPRGRVSTYKAMARALGRPRAYRAVGNALNLSPGMPKVPCHRVVRSDGRVGGFAGGSEKKIRLLKKEGVEVRNDRVDLQKFGISF